MNREQRAYDRWLSTQPEGPPICEWYAKCENDAVGAIDHPILGPVPVCQRCTDKHEMGARLQPF